jgi:predicted nucleic acid-binding protein
MKFMSLLSFPNVHFWLALLLGNHVYRRLALGWWEQAAGTIAFFRLTQISVLRLLSTSAAMDGKPLNMAEAWGTYDKLYLDSGVAFWPEPPVMERQFRKTGSSER